ncbi:MAG: hypothetical protein WBL93_00225 [Lutisporaceae bacterium]
MNRIKNNKYLIMFIMSLCLVFMVIILLHSYYNLNDLTMAPSENWGRTTSLVTTELYKKQPSILVNDKYTDILTANKSNFTTIKIDRQTREVSYEILNIKGVESYKVQQFEWDTKNIYFIEDNNLYFATKNPSGGYSAKVKIADDVNDFDILEMEGMAAITASTKNGIALYRQDKATFVQAGEIYNISNLDSISSVLDNKGIIHVAAYAETNSVEFPIYYLTFTQDKWAMLGTKIEKSLSASWGINNIDIGIDDTDVYIFYEMVKWDQYGLSTKTYYSVAPLYSGNVDISFNRMFLTKEDEFNQMFFLNEPNTIKTQSNELKLSVVKDSYDKKYSNGFSSYIVTMDNGQIKDFTRATLNQRLVTHTAYADYQGDDILVYLDAAGGFNYEAFYTETGKDYVLNAAKPTRDDYQVALMNTIPGYVSTFILIIIKFTIYFPAILWFMMIEFFEIRSLRERPRLSYSIGFLIYLAVKMISFGTYYTPLSISQMPIILNFTGAKYIYAVGIAFLAVLIQKLLKKHDPEINLILEYIIFALIDIQITNLLFATYLV